MSNSNSKMIVFASILGAILATGILALNPSPMIKNAGAEIYDDQYGYDNSYYKDDNQYGHDTRYDSYDSYEHKPQHSKSSTFNQIAKCDNKIVNINGLDQKQIQRQSDENNLATQALNNQASPLDKALNALTGDNNGNSDPLLRVDKNIVNVCDNENNNALTATFTGTQSQVFTGSQGPTYTVTSPIVVSAGDDAVGEGLAVCNSGDFAISGGYVLNNQSPKAVEFFTVTDAPVGDDTWKVRTFSNFAEVDVGGTVIAKCFDNPPLRP